MMIWLIVFIVFMLVIAAMSVGVVLSKKPISGSCGGLNRLGMKKDCPICGGEKMLSDFVRDNGYYDAMKKIDNKKESVE